MIVKDKDYGKFGTFSITNRVNGCVWTGEAVLSPISTKIKNIIQHNRYYCERSELNKQIFEFGLDSFEVDMEDKGGIPLTRQEEYPFWAPGIYALYDVVNLKVYVGSSYNIRTRIDKHLKHRQSRRNGKLGVALDEVGRDNFHPIILEVVDDLNKLNERELYWIDKLDTINTGYNNMRLGWTDKGWMPCLG